MRNPLSESRGGALEFPYSNVCSTNGPGNFLITKSDLLISNIIHLCIFFLCFLPKMGKNFPNPNIFIILIIRKNKLRFSLLNSRNEIQLNK